MPFEPPGLEATYIQHHQCHHHHHHLGSSIKGVILVQEKHLATPGQRFLKMHKTECMWVVQVKYLLSA